MSDPNAQRDMLNKPNSSPSPSPQRHSVDFFSIQKELQDKHHELNIAYQTSLELMETNNDMQQHIEEQSIQMETLNANMIDSQMKADLLQRENQEYVRTIHQTNDKYEELLGELAVSREHLSNALDEINEYKNTLLSINHEIIHNTSDPPPKNNKNNVDLSIVEQANDSEDKLEKQQRKYDELLREHEKYRNEREQLVLLQIDFDDLKKGTLKLEKRNKLLSDQIVDLTYSNVQLEKEINDYSLDIDEQNNTIQYLQNENQTLMTQKLSVKDTVIESSKSAEPNKVSIGDKKRLYSSWGGPDTVLSVFVNNDKETDTLKRRLSVGLRENFGYNSKLLMFADNIDENGSVEMASDMDDEPEQDLEQTDLFTMVQSYDNNEEYLMNAEMEEMNEESLSELSEKRVEKEEKKEEKKEETPPPKKDKLANKSREEKALDPKAPKKVSPRSQTRSGRRPSYKSKKKRSFPRKKAMFRKTDALDEYLHLTASAVKINYPTVNATSKELIEMVRSMAFYQAHDHLNRYMMDRLRWEQIQQNKLLQLKAAAIQAQRDHEIAQQSSVTRFFKKWFTSEYDDVDDIVYRRPSQPNKGKVDLSAPLSKKENLRLNRVGKAKLKATKYGGQSVNLGSLNPNGMPPKGINKKKRIVKTANSTPRRVHDHERRKKQRQYEHKLKTLSITQTLPSSRINDKNVQRMLEINADYLDKVIQNEAQKQEKNRKKPTIRITVPIKGQEQKVHHVEHDIKKKKDVRVNDEQKKKVAADIQKKRDPHDIKKKHIAPIHDAKQRKAKPRAKGKRKMAQQPPQKQGWFSWLSGSENRPPQQYIQQHKGQKRKQKIKKVKADAKIAVADPYALGPNEMKVGKRSGSDKERNDSKSRQSKSLIEVHKDDVDEKKEMEVPVDVNVNIKQVIDAQEAEDEKVVIDVDKQKEDVLNVEKNDMEIKQEEDVMDDMAKQQINYIEDKDQHKDEVQEVAVPNEAITEDMDINTNVEDVVDDDDDDDDDHKAVGDVTVVDDVKTEAIANDEDEEKNIVLNDTMDDIEVSPTLPSPIRSGDDANASIQDLAARIEDIQTEEKDDDQSAEDKAEDAYAINIEEMPEISVMDLHQTPLPEDEGSKESKDNNDNDGDHPISAAPDDDTQYEAPIIDPDAVDDVIESNLNDNSDDLDDVLQPVSDDQNKNDNDDS